MPKKKLLVAVAIACLGAPALAPGAQAAVIRYQFNNVSATGPWALYNYPVTIYWYLPAVYGPTAYFDLDTATNVVNTDHFLVSTDKDGNNYFGPNVPGVYDPTTRTVGYQGPYAYQRLTFSADLALGGPATLTSVALGGTAIDSSGLAVSTAVTGGVFVAGASGVPEPASMALLGAGLIGLGLARRVRTCRPAAA